MLEYNGTATNDYCTGILQYIWKGINPCGSGVVATVRAVESGFQHPVYDMSQRNTARHKGFIILNWEINLCRRDNIIW